MSLLGEIPLFMAADAIGAKSMLTETHVPQTDVNSVVDAAGKRSFKSNGTN